MLRRHISSGGVAIAVYEQGPADAPRVVLLHGYPDDARVWNGVVTVLAERWRVVRYDVRGAGASGQPADTGDYRLDQLASDLAAVVRATGGNGDEPVHLVGHDWGSVQGWHAVTGPHAGLFASFTAIAGPGLDQVRAWRTTVSTFAAVRVLARSWYIAAFQLPVVPELVWRVLHRRFRAAYRDAANGLWLYRANMMAPGDAGHRHTSVPVHQIVLTRDRYVARPLLDAARRHADDLTQTELDAGHWAHRDRPGEVAALIADRLPTPD